MTSSVLWLRRDLRLVDHPALMGACLAAETVAVVFCFDERLLAGPRASGPRTRFLLECLAAVDAGLCARGGRLVVRRGDPVCEVIAVARSCGAREIHFTADVSPYARARDRRFEEACRQTGIRPVSHPGLGVVDDTGALRTGDDRPHTSFRPFHRSWVDAPRRPLLDAPARVRLPDSVDPGRLPALAELGGTQTLSNPLRGGEPRALRRLERFLVDDFDSRGSQRQGGLGDRDSSRLSPYLRFGAISPRLVDERCDSVDFRRLLCWRDFFQHVVHHFPNSLRLEFQPRYRDLAWRRSARDLACWQDGRTGYPLVDAAMRQLRCEGWMPSRARLVVGSFLTKHLGIDWRAGESWFGQRLLDADPAQSTGNWQWIASVGADCQPVGRRILSPARQQRRFDIDGAYVRRWIPELDTVPTAYLAGPWRMPDDLQAECRCVIGGDYPRPIIDHAEARRAALERYRAVLTRCMT